MKKLIAGILLVLLTMPLPAAERPVVHGVMVNLPPVIDGDASDECWQNSIQFTDFYFLSDGSAAKEPTTAWVCYDQKNIYVAFHCKDSQPNAIQYQQKKRGGGTYTDDHVTLGIACYPDQGHTAGFTMTAGGVQSEHFDWADASKIEWRGDWQSAAKRVDDGYVVEMAVPFSILQYNPNQTSLGLYLQRRHARLDEYWASPNVGPAGDHMNWYLWDGLQLPKPNVRPKIMGYSVFGAGSDDSPHRAGLDIKHALTPGLTGLLAVNPYFDDVEQAVAGIDFTYNERYLPDSRPFFQEGVGYFPWSNILYTTRIRDIDAGTKFYGKAYGLSIAAMNTQKFGDESHTCIQLGKEWAARKNFYLCGVQSHVGTDDYTSTMISTEYRFIDKPERKFQWGGHAIVSDNPLNKGTLIGTGLRWYGKPKMLEWGMDYQSVTDDYDPYLGYTPERDLRSFTGWFGVSDQPSKGKLSNWSSSVSWDITDHVNGSPFHKGISMSNVVGWRNGSGVCLYFGRHDRVPVSDTPSPTYKDSHIGLDAWWGEKDLFNNGNLGLALGRRAGGSYVDYYISRSWGLSDSLNLYTGYEFSRVKPPSPNAYSASQLISTLAYDLDNERTLAGRLVAQKGKTNFYLAYKQRVRVGMDAYVIFGDPNADSTRSSFALKLVKLL